VPRLAAGVVANSQATLDTLGRVRAKPTWVIPDSVEVSARASLLAHDGGAAFGMLGRIAPWKGQEPVPARLRRRLPLRPRGAP